MCVRQDAIFVLDLEHVRKEDIVAEHDTGLYSKELRHYRWVVTLDNDKWKRVQMSKIDNTLLKMLENEFHLYWVYETRHTLCKDPLEEILDYDKELDECVIIGQHGYPGVTLVLQTSLSEIINFMSHEFQCQTTLVSQDKRHPWVLLAVALHDKRNIVFIS